MQVKNIDYCLLLSHTFKGNNLHVSFFGVICPCLAGHWCTVLHLSVLIPLDLACVVFWLLLWCFKMYWTFFWCVLCAPLHCSKSLYCACCVLGFCSWMSVYAIMFTGRSRYACAKWQLGRHSAECWQREPSILQYSRDQLFAVSPSGLKPDLIQCLCHLQIDFYLPKKRCQHWGRRKQERDRGDDLQPQQICMTGQFGNYLSSSSPPLVGVDGRCGNHPLFTFAGQCRWSFWQPPPLHPRWSMQMVLLATTPSSPSLVIADGPVGNHPLFTLAGQCRWSCLQPPPSFITLPDQCKWSFWQSLPPFACQHGWSDWQSSPSLIGHLGCSAQSYPVFFSFPCGLTICSFQSCWIVIFANLQFVVTTSEETSACRHQHLEPSVCCK